MLELQHGHVVCINSILSQSPIPGVIDYCTSKSSSLAFMESLTLGLLDCPGVGCTTVLPFHTSTEMFQGMRVRYAELFVLTSPPSVMCWKTFSLQIWSDFLPTPRCGNGVLIVKALCLFSIYNSVLVGNHIRMSLPFMVTEVPSFICFCALKQFYFILQVSPALSTSQTRGCCSEDCRRSQSWQGFSVPALDHARPCHPEKVNKKIMYR